MLAIVMVHLLVILVLRFLLLNVEFMLEDDDDEESQFQSLQLFIVQQYPSTYFQYFVLQIASCNGYLVSEIM